MLASATAYLVCLVTFVAIDLTWLGVMAPRFYKPTLGDLAVPGVNLPPALLFYVLYPIGLLIFAIEPALKSGSMSTALISGALFGFFTYATYDLTNQATLRNWTLQLTLVDVAWGTILGAVSASISFWLVTKLVNVY
jgi:uncharacterized membrane protein